MNITPTLSIRNASYWLISGSITCAGLVAVFSFVELRAALAAAAQFDLFTLSLVLSLLAAGAFIAGIRLRTIAADMGLHLTVREALAAMAAGQVVGAVTFQFFGQIAARSIFLKSRGVNLPANIAIVGYERLIALAVSAFGASCGVLILFGRIVPDIDAGFSDFFRLSLGFILVVPGAMWIGWRQLAKEKIYPLITKENITSILRNVFLTVSIQLCTALAYIVAVRGLVPSTNTVELIGACLIVMFAASVPVSFAGWGIREISAVFALSTIGISAAQSVAAAVLIGLGSLGVVAIIACFTAFQAASTRQASNFTSSFNPLTFVCWTTVLGTATLIIFQLYIPTPSGHLNVNAADLLAMIAGIIFTYIVISGGSFRWRLPYFDWHLIAATAALLLSLAIGWLRFGFSDWAFINKGFGWFILLGYVATGALAATFPNGIQTTILTFVGAVAAACCLDLILFTLRAFGWETPITHQQMDGFSQNRNAFTLLILLALACIPFFTRWRTTFLALISLSVFMAGSRAGLITLPIMLGLSLWLKAAKAREVLLGLVIASLVIIFWEAVSSINDKIFRYNEVLHGPLIRDNSITERLASLKGGLDLFLQHPILGAGLGSFMRTFDLKALEGGNLIIHSTPIWLLAEMGLVGFIAFVSIPMRIVLHEWRIRDRNSAALLMLCVAFGLMSAVHEMLYQRPIWLLLGLLLAAPNSLEPSSTNNDMQLAAALRNDLQPSLAEQNLRKEHTD